MLDIPGKVNPGFLGEFPAVMLRQITGLRFGVDGDKRGFGQ